MTSNVDVICTMVGFPSDVKEVYDVIFSCIEAGKTCIDFTTSSPKLAKELYTKRKRIGCSCIGCASDWWRYGSEKMVL